MDDGWIQLKPQGAGDQIGWFIELDEAQSCVVKCGEDMSSVVWRSVYWQDCLAYISMLYHFMVILNYQGHIQ